MYETLTPLKFEGCNIDLKSRPLTPEERLVSLSDKMLDCSCYTDGIQSITKWKTKSIKARLHFLLFGEMNVVELRKTPVAKAVTIGKVFAEH